MSGLPFNLPESLKQEWLHLPLMRKVFADMHRGLISSKQLEILASRASTVWVVLESNHMLLDNNHELCLGRIDSETKSGFSHAMGESRKERGPLCKSH